ncbi:hypothetical protein FF38_00873 [Lucilia cuprina]|uniref:Uncharacterized protein n=1 Tax=Lucilia cuprina TaxID=7375 RepID=A0A0L0C1Y0_LUCCU|nr:hypothetical protein FF38_00873 [Lucilia cuprina]
MRHGAINMDHVCITWDNVADHFKAATAFWAASSKSAAVCMGKPEFCKILRASSTFVPSRRTTSGTFRLSFFEAATTPLAMVAQLTIPPNTLTKIPFTLGSEKLAGSPPFNLIISIVAMAKPAPFTKQPILPSMAT